MVLRARCIVPQFRKPCPTLPHGGEFHWRKGDLPGQEGLTRTKRHRTDLDDDFNQQSGVMELADEVASANQPHVFSTGCSKHCCMDGTNVTADKMQFHAFDGGQISRTEHLAWLFVRPIGSRVRAFCCKVAQHPLVHRRSHCQCSHIAYEIGIAGIANVAKLEQPFE
jgi:hypothetical protein